MVVEEPEFTEVIENVTVPAGRNVRMACSVKNLGTFKASDNEKKLIHTWNEQLNVLAFLDYYWSIDMLRFIASAVLNQRTDMCVRNMSGKLSTYRISTDTYSFIYAYGMCVLWHWCSSASNAVVLIVASMHVCDVLWRQYKYYAATAIVFAFINENWMRVNGLVVVVLITCQLSLFFPFAYIFVVPLRERISCKH